MFGLPIGFASPWLLLGLLSLPVIWWLLRLTPPRPQEETFPPTRILARLEEREETPAQSPWWLTLLRLSLAALVILAMAGPVLNPDETDVSSDGPVMLVVDDGWASAKEWETRSNTALGIIANAQEQGQPVILISSTGRSSWTGLPVSADEAAALINAAEANPLSVNHEAAATLVLQGSSAAAPGEVHWLSNGLVSDQTSALTEAVSGLSVRSVLYGADTSELLVLGELDNDPASMTGAVIRADATSVSQFEVTARDSENVVIARSGVIFLEGETQATYTFDEPVEIRNQISKLSIDAVQSAGAVKLLDENNRRRLVGLISGETYDQSQPLLSPLYYISRALEPFSDIRRSDDASAAGAVPDLINQGVAVIILADVGALPEDTSAALEKWVTSGGMLIRFAGPKLGSAPESSLLPVEIRPGDRNLGGALSWETPKPLAPFDRSSPFFGIEQPRDVLVTKQILALQESGLQEKTWSTLDDGTPLVTAEKNGAGHIVLFHVGSDANWSNLPLSGTFVEMLRRTVNLSTSSSYAGTSESELVLPPLKILDGKGRFVAAGEDTQPLVVSKSALPDVRIENPPGFYGTTDGLLALNLFNTNAELELLDGSPLVGGFEKRAYASSTEIEFRSWLLLAAALLLLLDCLAVLWMSGAMRSAGSVFARTSQSTSAIMLGIALAAVVSLTPLPVASQQVDDDGFNYSAALQTRLAYVITGLDTVDEVSEAGMYGLTRYISTRTALEPGEPVGLDLASDELSFYSLIYWPVDPAAPLPDTATMARVDAYMKQGGSILFDTRDQISGILGGTASSPAARALQQILTTLDIPPLEPVPEDHVLTKSFYLLEDFPGRYSGGNLWVEASQRRAEEAGRPARSGDGVSSILITSNDLSGAWAVDSDYRPLFPTVPPDPIQRNYAFRVGVNLMMYALTGNYKADQVHLPALLERLGQ